jgi:hypothetical protein
MKKLLEEIPKAEGDATLEADQVDSLLGIVSSLAESGSSFIVEKGSTETYDKLKEALSSVKKQLKDSTQLE